MLGEGARVQAVTVLAGWTFLWKETVGIPIPRLLCQLVTQNSVSLGMVSRSQRKAKLLRSHHCTHESQYLHTQEPLIEMKNDVQSGNTEAQKKPWEPSGVGLQWSLPVELLAPHGAVKKVDHHGFLLVSACHGVTLPCPGTWDVRSSDSTRPLWNGSFYWSEYFPAQRKKILKIPLTLWIWFNTTQPNGGEVRERICL